MYDEESKTKRNGVTRLMLEYLVLIWNGTSSLQCCNLKRGFMGDELNVREVMPYTRIGSRNGVATSDDSSSEYSGSAKHL